MNIRIISIIIILISFSCLISKKNCKSEFSLLEEDGIYVIAAASHDWIVVHNTICPMNIFEIYEDTYIGDPIYYNHESYDISKGVVINCFIGMDARFGIECLFVIFKLTDPELIYKVKNRILSDVSISMMYYHYDMYIDERIYHFPVKVEFRELSICDEGADPYADILYYSDSHMECLEYARDFHLIKNINKATRRTKYFP